MSSIPESFEAFIARALRSPDPVLRLRERLADPNLDVEERARLRAVDEDGFRVAALIVAKLRFERLMQGSARVAHGFATDAQAFADAFREYHEQVPMTSPMPWVEGKTFEDWARRQANA